MDVLEEILKKKLERKNNYCRILQDKINKLKTIIKLFKVKEK